MKRRSNKPIDFPLLTIGVPAYNVEAYLETCLNPLTEPYFSKLIEVIVIDDGSSDGTSSIASTFTEKYSHISLISKKNGGHGSAINTALRLARGKYFKLLDGDDRLDASALSVLLNTLQTTNADIVLTNYVEHYTSSDTYKSIKNYEHLAPGNVYSLDSGNDIFSDKGPLLATTTFKTSIYKDNPFYIDEKCFYVDMEYNFFVFQRAKTVEYLPSDLYIYRLDREGQSMQRTSQIKNYRDHGRVSLRLSKELSLIPEDAKEYNYLFTYIVAPVCRSQYQILTEFMGNRRAFLEFDNNLRKFPKVYNSPLVSGKIITIHRKMRGYSIKGNTLLRRVGRMTKK